MNKYMKVLLADSAKSVGVKFNKSPTTYWYLMPKDLNTPEQVIVTTPYGRKIADVVEESDDILGSKWIDQVVRPIDYGAKARETEARLNKALAQVERDRVMAELSELLGVDKHESKRMRDRIALELNKLFCYI